LTTVSLSDKTGALDLFPPSADGDTRTSIVLYIKSKMWLKWLKFNRRLERRRLWRGGAVMG
jgi:hypothetical protein